MSNPTEPTRKVADYERCCKRAAKFANRHDGGLDLAEKFLFRCGWEHFEREYATIGNRELCYLSTGETHNLTIAQEGGSEVLATSWGDWYESAEQEYEQENDVIRCGYCGKFADRIDGVDWSETPCPCGNLVSG